LENNILVTRDAPIDLFKDIPVEADESEGMMVSKGKKVVA